MAMAGVGVIPADSVVVPNVLLSVSVKRPLSSAACFSVDEIRRGTLSVDGLSPSASVPSAAVTWVVINSLCS